MNKLGVYVLLLHLTHTLADGVVSYRGYRVYKVSEKGLKIPKLKIPNNPERLSVLTEHHEFDREHNPFTVRSYLVPQHTEEDFRRILLNAGADFNISSHDLETEIDEERKSYMEALRRPPSDELDVTGKYFSHRDICEFLSKIDKIKNPKNDMPIAVVESIGKSLEGRETHLVKISSDHNAQKPVIFIEAGIHAREWTAPSAALYTIHQLVSNHTHTFSALDNIDYYIIPLSNPDGYEYSRTTDRLWRKTRSLNKGHFGVDGNRNFDFHWGEAGTSSNPRSEIYKGPYPFSEAETRNIRDAGMKYKNRIKVFVALHAYGPCILYPWSFKSNIPTPQADIMDRIAEEAADAIKRFSGRKYTHGSSTTLMYEAAGGSDDYFKGVLGVDLTFTFELSSADKSSFIIPTFKIYEIASEAFEGFKVIAENGARYRRKRIKEKSKFAFR